MVAERAPASGVATPGRSTRSDELDEDTNELDTEQHQELDDHDEQATVPTQSGSVFNKPFARDAARAAPLTLDEDDDEAPTTTAKPKR